MARSSFVILCAAIIFIAAAKAQSGSCPLFGTDQTSLSRSREERIFLNFEAPAQCRGNVTSWRYCNYRSSVGDDDDDDDDDNANLRYGAKFIVYRRSSPNSVNYVQVAGSVTELIVLNSFVTSSFSCREVIVTQPFEIQENDVVAGCVWDQGSVNPLYLIGDTNDQNAIQSLYQVDRRGYDDCTTSQLASVDTSRSDFRHRGEWRLHLYANIAVPTFCRVGDNPSATAPVSTNLLSGTYLNTNSPVNCATQNAITSWQYCYYTSAVTPGQTYTMTVGVWSLDSGMYRLTEGSNRTLTLVPIATFAKIFCVQETLNTMDVIFVTQNDVIGVVVPATNPIPVLSSSTGSTLLRHPQSVTPSSLLASQFATISNTALHLYSNLEFVAVPTTEAPTTLAMTTEAMTTTEVQVTTTAQTTMSPTTEAMTTTEVPTTAAQTTVSPTTEVPTTETQTTVLPTTEVPTTAAQTTTEVPTAAAETTMSPTTEVPVTTAAISPTTDVTMGDASTTSQPPDTNTVRGPGDINTMTSSSTAIVDDQRQGLSSGDVSAVILSLILVIIIGTVATVLGVYFYKRRTKRSYGFDNVVYQVENTAVVFDSKAAEAEDGYDTIMGEYLTAIPQLGCKNKTFTESEQIYQEIPEIEGETEFSYYSPLDAAQDYHERLEEARRGTVSSIKEDPYYNPANDESAIYTELKKQKILTISGSNIKIGQNLGSGQFGTVDQATWTQSPGYSVEVAVKTLKRGASSVDRVKFLQEAAIMAQFRHPNVVTLHGVAQQNDQRMLVVELLSKGDLRNFLLNLRPDPGELVQDSTSHLLLEFSQQICLGMSYLASKGFIHRDLAARNILISADNICKIADFGMSRDLQDTDYYVSSGGKIPLKWTAPEAIHYKKYSTASDVWSYGCVLYEIWSLGTKPFDGLSNVELLRNIQDGVRLSPPPGCPKRIYEVMIQTWSGTANDRPEFREILLFLLENKSVVLRIPPEAMTSHPQAGVLGAPLEAGENMYTELQNTYT